MQRMRRIPRGEKRRDEIAAVAEQVFLELGFNDTTMQIVASRAGASKETLYRHFGSKEGLFSEVIRTRAARFFGDFEREIGQHNDPRAVLKELGFNMLNKLLNDDRLCLFRIVVYEVQRTPEIGRIFFEQGPKQLLKEVSNYLEYATAQGMLNCDEPLLQAKLFLGAVVANRHIIQLVAPDEEKLTEEVIRRHVEEAVSMFLAAYGPKVETRERVPEPALAPHA
jgi:TetR/AcrR family transcriptional regulator, mexJK operon transcriptional repressor